MKNERPENLTLGCVAKDSISGFKGVVIAITEWLNGCQRVTIQPKELKDGKPIEAHTFDAEQVMVVTPVAAPKTVERLSLLSFDQANAMIRRLGGEPFRSYGNSKRMENYRKQQAGIKTIETDAQLTLIHELARVRGWSEESLQKFCNRVIKRDSPSTTDEGNKIVEGLKAMNRRDGLLSFPKQRSTINDQRSAEPKFRRVA